jgi:hypothetical protein
LVRTRVPTETRVQARAYPTLAGAAANVS